jgi:protein SCO1/2
VLAAFLMSSAVAAHELTPEQLRSLTFEQRLGQRIPLDLTFRDEAGRPVALADYFGQRPVILTMNYYHCQNLCPLEIEGLLRGLNGVTLGLGQDFGIVSVSIDPRESADEATTTKLRGLRAYKSPQNGAAWHVLTGDQQQIAQLAQAVGFTYTYDPDVNEYAHPLGVVVLTPDGQISSYLFGLDFAAADLRLALIEASNQRIGSLLDRALLICYHYDPLTGRYTSLAVNVLRGGGAATVLALAIFVGWLWRGELRRKSPPPEAVV